MSAFIVAICAFGPSPASAQDNSTGYVNGAGTATLERLPNIMRVYVQLSGRGSSLAEALAALKDRREATIAALPTLGAVADSIEIGDPDVTRGEDQQKMNQMILDRMGRTKRGASGSTTKLPTTATAKLTAEWLLEADDAERLLTKVSELQEKIKAADLGGAKEAAKLSPEEEELRAEMQQYGGGQEANPAEPQFVFVVLVGDDERAKLAAEAFEKAKKNAEQLAVAAGAKLGRLASLQSHDQSGGLNEGYSEYYGGNAYLYEMQRRQYQMLQASTQGEPESAAEAHGLKPGKVKYSVRVQASFRLE
jgi:uncharacterized protein YggE